MDETIDSETEIRPEPPTERSLSEKNGKKHRGKEEE